MSLNSSTLIEQYPLIFSRESEQRSKHASAAGSDGISDGVFTERLRAHADEEYSSSVCAAVRSRLGWLALRIPTSVYSQILDSRSFFIFLLSDPSARACVLGVGLRDRNNINKPAHTTLGGKPAPLYGALTSAMPSLSPLTAHVGPSTACASRPSRPQRPRSQLLLCRLGLRRLGQR